MNDELKSAAADPALGAPGIQTLGSSTLYNLLEEMIRLRSRNEAQHKMFAQDLTRLREDLKTSFNSFAADTQRAYQDLRKEIQGEKKFSLGLLNEVLEVSQDLEHLVAARPALNDTEALKLWIEAIEIESRKVKSALVRHGIKEYDAVISSPYNPALHERVGSARVEGMGPLLVAEQRERGYASQQTDFVLRRPKVIVSERFDFGLLTQEVCSMPYIGIDFGTSNSVAANFQYGQAEVLPNHEGHKWTPSIVTLRRDGTLAFGQEAKENFDEQRSIRSIKRILGTPERVPLIGQNLRTEQIAVMLFSLLKKDAEQYLNESFVKAVVTIPANSKGLARHATKLCAGAAGMQVLTLINEPTAAAICYGLNAQDDQTVLVYDFGGGTLDVTVLRIHHGIFEEVSSKGIGKLGGDDIDAALAKVIGERFQERTGYDIMSSPYKQQFMLAVEKAKIDLSSETTAFARKAELVPERHLSLEEEIERGQFERIIMPLVVKSGTAIDEALKLRGLRPKDIDKVLLVGGTSKIPLVKRYVSEKLGGKEPEPFERVDPMTCVAQGAAIVSAILQGAPGLDNYAYSVKLEHSLCANPVDQRTNRVFLDPIIKRGADIPCSFTKTYYPVADPADRVLISVFEGDIYDTPENPENVKLAEIPWEFKPPRTQRDGGLDVTFEYGDDGILTVQIHDIHASQKKRFAIQQSGDNQLSASQIMDLKAKNNALVNRTMELESSQEYKDAVEVLKKTEQDVIPRIESPEDRRELEELCREVRQAMGSGDRKKMEEASALLNDKLLNYAYLL